MNKTGKEKLADKGHVDWIILGMYLLFISLGWLNVYAASFDLEHAQSVFDISERAYMQLLWMGTSLLLALFIIKIDLEFYERYAFLFYIIGIFLLIVTVLIAPNIKGSRSWLVLGPIRLQPAEFMKFVIALNLAKLFNSYGFKLMSGKNLLITISLILLPVALVILQSETGTALVYLSLILILYREGLPGSILSIGATTIIYFIVGIKYSDTQLGLLSLGEVITFALIGLFTSGLILNYMKRVRTSLYLLLLIVTPFLIGFLLKLQLVNVNFSIISIISLSLTIIYVTYLTFRYRKKTYFYLILFILGSIFFIKSADYVFNDVLQPHQQIRVKVALGMENDLRGSGYHVGQSKIAIGSGGLFGKGYLNGTQTKLKYVPEQDTDFIFCTIGEEWGFVGSAAVILMLSFFILRLTYLAEQQSSAFGRVYGYGVVSIMLFHLIINIGMVIGLVPVIGIPLPFFSYGGSSLWGFTILLFIFLRIDKARKHF